MTHQLKQVSMAGSNNTPQPQRPNSPSKGSAEGPKKPLQVMHISKKESQSENEENVASSEGHGEVENLSKENLLKTSPVKKDFDDASLEGLSMEDLLSSSGGENSASGFSQKGQINDERWMSRSVDDFDFDEDAFLAALDENEPIGGTGEIIKGEVIGVESDGVYVDIGGKAPGFMPKKECGLGVITNLKERFPKGLELEVLVTREQNAEGIVTISCRALALRQSWEKVQKLEKEGKVLRVEVNGFNRGGVTCDLEGLRGFIPRSQLEDGENHEKLIGKNLSIAFIEVNPDTRKLILSEKRAVTMTRFSELEIGQLAKGKIAAIKPYGFFVDLGGISGLLHHSMITNGSLRSLREVFKQGEDVKALITELDPRRGRITLNTALLEATPGEIIIEKAKVMNEAEERAEKIKSTLNKKEESKSEPTETQK